MLRDRVFYFWHFEKIKKNKERKLGDELQLTGVNVRIPGGNVFSIRHKSQIKWLCANKPNEFCHSEELGWSLGGLTHLPPPPPPEAPQLSSYRPLSCAASYLGQIPKMKPAAVWRPQLIVFRAPSNYGGQDYTSSTQALQDNKRGFNQVSTVPSVQAETVDWITEVFAPTLQSGGENRSPDGPFPSVSSPWSF